jgi:hypothetical protein
MSWPGASPDEMPGFPFPDRLAPELGEPLLDTVLNRQPLPPDAPEQLHAVAGMLASLAGPAAPGELAGEATARLAFARAIRPARVSPAGRSPARRRLSGLPGRLTARVAAVVIAAAAGLGSVAGAYAGVLPGPVQDFAHHAIGAPPARHAPDHPPAGHRAAGQLCTSFDHGSGPARAAASRDLAKAAGRPGRIGAYCAAAGKPGPPAAAHPDSNRNRRHGNHGGGKPATHGNGIHGKHGGGKPATNSNSNAVRHNAKDRTSRRGNPRHGKPDNPKPDAPANPGKR